MPARNLFRVFVAGVSLLVAGCHQQHEATTSDLSVADPFAVRAALPVILDNYMIVAGMARGRVMSGVSPLKVEKILQLNRLTLSALIHALQQPDEPTVERADAAVALLMTYVSED